ncbi:unnamed protein product [Camellia sinensis]
MPKPRLALIFLLLHLLILHLTSPISAIRKDASLQGKHICRTTVQGRYLLSDDNEAMYVMHYQWIQSLVAALEKESNLLVMDATLLRSAATHTNFVFHAARTLQKTQKELALKVKISKPATAGTYLSVFDFCSGRCRHNSESVMKKEYKGKRFSHYKELPSTDDPSEVLQHKSSNLGELKASNFISLGFQSVRENQIVSQEAGLPGTTDALVEARIAGINVIIGSMQKYMSCKGACLASIGADQPAEVVDDAPKDLLIQERACTLEHNQCFLVMVRIGIQGGFAPVAPLKLQTRERWSFSKPYRLFVVEELLKRV